MVQRTLPPAAEHKLLPPPKAHISRTRVIIFAVLGLLLLLAIFFLGLLPRRKRERQAAALAQQQATSFPSVNAIAARRSASVANLLLPGAATPYQESYLYARATGYVIKRYADIGDRVRKDQLLAQIDAPDLDAQVSQARAQVAQSERQLAQSQASLENAQAQEELARVTVDRYKVLVDHGAVSRQDYDQQNANYKQAQANVHLQEASIETAQENIRANRANLEHVIALQTFEQVRAPFDGVITARNFDVGALVTASGATQGASTPLGGTQSSAASNNAGANGSSQASSGSSLPPSSPATPGIGSSGELYRIAQIDRLRVLVSVPQDSAAAVQVGSHASVYVSEYGDRSFPGTVTRTANSLDAISRTLPVEVQVVNPGYKLLPGMFAQVQFTDTRPSPPLLVPGDAIITTPDGLYIAVLTVPTEQDKQEIQKREEALKKAQRDNKDQQNSDKQKADQSKESGSDKKSDSKRSGDDAQEGDTQPNQKQDPNQIRRIHLSKVQVGRDYGQELEISSGLRGTEYVVVNPGDKVQEGALVMPRAAPPVAGQNGNQRKAESEQKPVEIQSPSMAAPTLAPQQNGKGNGKGGQKNGNGNQKGGGGK